MKEVTPMTSRRLGTLLVILLTMSLASEIAWSAEPAKGHGQRTGLLRLLSDPAAFQNKVVTVGGIVRFYASEPYLYPSNDAFVAGLTKSGIRVEITGEHFKRDPRASYLFTGEFSAEDSRGSAGVLTATEISLNPDSAYARRTTIVGDLRKLQSELRDGKTPDADELLLAIDFAIEFLEPE